MTEVIPDPIDDVSPLEALLELPRSASEDSLDDFLVTVADTVCRTAEFGTVVLRLYRPEWDDYSVALVAGHEESVTALTGTAIPRAAFGRILAEAEQQVPGVFFLSQGSGFWEDLNDIYTLDLSPVEDPNAWLPEDGILVFLSDSEGAPLGLVTMDEPASGLRPTLQDLRLFRAICSHAETALETARRTEAAAEHARILSLLLETSPALSACRSSTELFEVAGRIVVPGLGFERFAGYARQGDELVRAASEGWDEKPALPATLVVAEIDALLAPMREQAGCFLGSAAPIFSDLPPGSEARSRRNGAGATAWSDHCLVIPCRTSEGEMHGLVVVEDPIDRLLPSADRRRALRLLVDQAAAALLSIDQRIRLHHLASHDPLTGVRNRRGLHRALSGHDEVALLVCDLDHFKNVNDLHGHEVGDTVLARFGELLRELARETDVPIRLGGEEFCVVMPGTDPTGAVRAAERLRLETMARLTDLVPGGLTVSIGVAATGAGVLDARALLAAADRGLYAAKAAGRNRSVFDKQL